MSCDKLSVDEQQSCRDGILDLIQRVESGFLCDPLICADMLLKANPSEHWERAKELISRIDSATSELCVLLGTERDDEEYICRSSDIQLACERCGKSTPGAGICATGPAKLWADASLCSECCNELQQQSDAHNQWVMRLMDEGR